MSYLFQNRCYATTTQLAEAVASSCDLVSGGQLFKCSPISDQVRVRILDMDGGFLQERFVTPVLTPCDVDLTDLTPVLFEVSLIWIAAFIIAVIIKKLLR